MQRGIFGVKQIVREEVRQKGRYALGKQGARKKGDWKKLRKTKDMSC